MDEDSRIAVPAAKHGKGKQVDTQRDAVTKETLSLATPGATRPGFMAMPANMAVEDAVPKLEDNEPR